MLDIVLNMWCDDSTKKKKTKNENMNQNENLQKLEDNKDKIVRRERRGAHKKPTFAAVWSGIHSFNKLFLSSGPPINDSSLSFSNFIPFD